MLIDTGGSLLLGTELIEQGNLFVYTNPCIHKYLQIFLCVFIYIVLVYKSCHKKILQTGWLKQ